jgi:hypothetical protein
MVRISLGLRHALPIFRKCPQHKLLPAPDVVVKIVAPLYT